MHLHFYVFVDPTSYTWVLIDVWGGRVPSLFRTGGEQNSRCLATYGSVKTTFDLSLLLFFVENMLGCQGSRPRPCWRTYAPRPHAAKARDLHVSLQWSPTLFNTDRRPCFYNLSTGLYNTRQTCLGIEISMCGVANEIEFNILELE